MAVDREQRRLLIAAICKVAWADGVIDEAERSYVQALIARLGGEPMDAGELDRWLAEGVPDEALGALPPGLDQFFFYEALRLAESDGDLDPREQEIVEAVMNRAFAKDEEDPEGSALARIVLRKRAVPREES